MNDDKCISTRKLIYIIIVDTLFLVLQLLVLDVDRNKIGPNVPVYLVGMNDSK